MKKGDKNVNKVINLLLRILLALFLVSGLIFFESSKIFIDLIFNAARKGFFLPLLWIYIGIVLIYSLLYTKIKLWTNEKKVQISIFALAMIPRFIFCVNSIFIPVDDFKNYLLYGQYMYFGQYKKIADIIANYNMPKMGGIAIFNGLISSLFSPQLIGFQIANCIITSLICVFIYMISRRMSKEVGLGAALIFALYPSNIISTQITTNHHAATLMALIGIVFFLKAMENRENSKGYLYILFLSIFFTVSNFIHPSVIIFILSIFLYLLIFILNSKPISASSLKELIKRCISYCLIFITVYSLLTNISINAFYKIGIIKTKDEIPVLFKVVM